MSEDLDVVAAAEARATALKESDADALMALLHPSFGWVSHRGEQFDRDGYIGSNVAGRNPWHDQTMDDVEVWSSVTRPSFDAW